jgi:hypothetical protein
MFDINDPDSLLKAKKLLNPEPEPEFNPTSSILDMKQRILKDKEQTLPEQSPLEQVKNDIQKEPEIQQVASNEPDYTSMYGLEPVDQQEEPQQSIDDDRPKTYAEKIHHIESRGNTNAQSRTGAKGLYQITETTRRALDKIPKLAEKYNLDNCDLMDPDCNHKYQEALTDHNSLVLKRNNFDVNDTNLYMFHNIGSSNGLSLLRSNPDDLAVNVLRSDKAWAYNPSFFLKKIDSDSDKLEGNDVVKIMKIIKKHGIMDKNKLLKALRLNGFEPMTVEQSINKYSRMLGEQ